MNDALTYKEREILNEFLEKSKCNLIDYDFKNEFKKNTDFENGLVLAKNKLGYNSNLHNWLLYKKSKLHIDCDVAFLSIIIFKCGWNFLENGTIIEQNNRYNSDNKKFEIKLDDGTVYKGDSMNSFWTTFIEALGILFKKTDPVQKIESDEEKLRYEFALFFLRFKIISKKVLQNYFNEDSLSEYPEYNKSLRGKKYNGDLSDIERLSWLILNLKKIRKMDLDLFENLERFAQLTHSVGNFIPVPEEFNNGRALKKTKDYFDLTLKCIHDYYLPIKPSEGNNRAVLSQFLKVTAIDKCEKWLERFNGWDEFVEKNYLQDFVNEICLLDAPNCKSSRFGEPKLFWKGHSLERPCPQVIEDVKDFLENVNVMIELRGARIYKALNPECKDEAEHLHFE